MTHHGTDKPLGFDLSQNRGHINLIINFLKLLSVPQVTLNIKSWHIYVMFVVLPQDTFVIHIPIGLLLI